MKYAEAINRSKDEQLLLSIVKGRYGETSSFLTVNGVAANLRFRAELGVEARFPGAGDPGDDLVLGGIAYEESPTITYTPVQGDLYVRQLLAPIPLDILVMAVRSVASNDRLFDLLVSRINNLRNPCFVRHPTSAPDSGFVRFVELFGGLSTANVLEVVVDPGEEVEFNLLISGYAPDYRDEVDERLGLLDLESPAGMEDDLVIPIYLAVVPKKSRSIGITTRSTFELVEILRATVAVPSDTVTTGSTSATMTRPRRPLLAFCAPHGPFASTSRSTTSRDRC